MDIIKKMLPIILGIVLSLLYYFKILIGIKSILSDIIAFDAAVFSFFLVFITILIAIKDTCFFIRIQLHFPKAINDIFEKIKKSLILCIALFIYCLFLKILNLNKFLELGEKGFIYFKSFGFFILVFIISNLLQQIFYLITSVYSTVLEATKLLDKKEETNEFID